MRRQAVVGFGLGCFFAALVSTASAQAPPAPAAAQMARGEYLVTRVAMCTQCHSPRNEAGELEQDQLLQGARMPIASPYSSMMFAVSTPKLAGLPAGFREEDLVRLLRTGSDHRGRTPRPPMPPFRMNEEDARAIAAYLSSLR